MPHLMVQVDSHNPIRCGTGEAVDRFSKVIEDCKEKKDSIGGVVTCVVRNVPVGLGEPCFDKLEAKIAHAMLSIPATKVHHGETMLSLTVG